MFRSGIELVPVAPSDEPMSEQFPITPLTAEQRSVLRAELDKSKEALEDEWGPYITEELPTGRILVLPSGGEVPHVAYMSDDSPDARLVLDDYVPEIGDMTMDPEYPSDNQPGG